VFYFGNNEEGTRKRSKLVRLTIVIPVFRVSLSQANKHWQDGYFTRGGVRAEQRQQGEVVISVLQFRCYKAISERM